MEAGDQTLYILLLEPPALAEGPESGLVARGCGQRQQRRRQAEPVQSRRRNHNLEPSIEVWRPPDWRVVRVHHHEPLSAERRSPKLGGLPAPQGPSVPRILHYQLGSTLCRVSTGSHPRWTITAGVKS